MNSESPPADFWGKTVPGRRNRTFVYSEMNKGLTRALWNEVRSLHGSNTHSHGIFFMLGSYPVEPTGRPPCISPRLPLPDGP